MSDEISDEYKKKGKCDKYAEALENKMKSNNISGEKIEVSPKTGKSIIYSDEFGQIGNNGFHQGIKVGDTIFDNLHPNGISYEAWVKDLGGELYNFFKIIAQW